jgi:hypothetical protein
MDRVRILVKDLVKDFKDIFTPSFRARPPIRDRQELAQFVDENAAFVVQKGIYEYSRARAGHYAKVLFAEEEFRTAVDVSRWRAYPLGLAMVAELVEGILRPLAGAEAGAQLEVLRGLALSVFDRYDTPAALGQSTWRDARADLARRLQLIGLHAPKRAMDIPEPFVVTYFDLMPIHKSLRGRDLPTTHNYLRVTMCNIHDVLSQRMDAAAVAASLRDARA